MKPEEFRHIMHQKPETALKEFETTEFIKSEIKKLDNMTIHRPLETGLVAEYTVNDGDYLLFRADIDGLVMEEETGWEYASTNGKMHACGHDIHASILYGFAQRVAETKPDQNFIFFFQPAEEGAGGANLTIKTGIFDNFNIRNAFALHVNDEFDFGTIAFNNGVLFASAMELVVDFTGKPAHVASPQYGKNALNAMRTFLDMAERIPNPVEDPLLLAIGKAEAGKVRNIVPEKARIEGSIRSLNMDKSRAFFDKLKEVGKALEVSCGVETDVQREAFYPEVNNDRDLFKVIKPRLDEHFNTKVIPYKMTGEDFGFFTRQYPSLMFWLGTGEDKRHGLHDPQFLPSDRIIEKGIEIDSVIAGL